MNKSLLSLLLLASSSLYASAEINVTLAGAPVAEGALLEVPCETFSYGDYTVYNWTPALAMSSTVPATVELQVTAGCEGVSVCWPKTCKEIQPGTSLTVDGQLGSKPEDMQIHRLVTLSGSDTSLEAGEISVEVRDADDPASSLSFSVKYLSPQASVAAIGSALPVETARFTATGVRLDAPAPGINIVRYSDGSVRKVIVH